MGRLLVGEHSIYLCVCVYATGFAITFRFDARILHACYESAGWCYYKTTITSNAFSVGVCAHLACFCVGGCEEVFARSNYMWRPEHMYTIYQLKMLYAMLSLRICMMCVVKSIREGHRRNVASETKHVICSVHTQTLERMSRLGRRRRLIRKSAQRVGYSLCRTLHRG